MGRFSNRLQLIKKAVAKAAYLDCQIDDSVRYQVVKQSLLAQALSSESIGVSSERIADKEVIVSLTTHALRIHSVYQTVESIFSQSVKPNRVILYLNKDEFSYDLLPSVLHKQCNRGLEIKFVEDLRVYTKLLPALRDFPDSIIITVDDDYMYPFDMVERLVKSYLSFPMAVSCFHSRQLRLKGPKELEPYSCFEMCFPEENIISTALMAEGFGGVLYPPGSMHEDVYDFELINKLSPFADDLWYKAMQLLKSTPVTQLARNRSWFQTITSETSVQDNALTHINIDKNGNDKQLKALFDYFDLYHLF